MRPCSRLSLTQREALAHDTTMVRDMPVGRLLSFPLHHLFSHLFPTRLVGLDRESFFMGRRQNSREQSEAPLLRDTFHPSCSQEKNTRVGPFFSFSQLYHLGP